MGFRLKIDNFNFMIFDCLPSGAVNMFARKIHVLFSNISAEDDDSMLIYQ